MESVHVVRMKPSDPLLAIQSNINVATEAYEKSARPMEKSHVTGTFILSWSGGTLSSINMKP